MSPLKEEHPHDLAKRPGLLDTQPDSRAATRQRFDRCATRGWLRTHVQEWDDLIPDWEQGEAGTN